MSTTNDVGLPGVPTDYAGFSRRQLAAAGSISAVLTRDDWPETKRAEVSVLVSALCRVPTVASPAAKPVSVDIAPIWRLLFGTHPAVRSKEVSRWLRHPLCLRRTGPMKLAFEQRLAGPCGVLAALQVWLLSSALFLRPAQLYEERSTVMRPAAAAALRRLEAQKTAQQRETGAAPEASTSESQEGEDDELALSFELAVLMALENRVLSRSSSVESSVDGSQSSSTDKGGTPEGKQPTQSHTEWCPLENNTTVAPVLSPCACVRAVCFAWALAVVMYRSTPGSLYIWAKLAPQAMMEEIAEAPDVASISSCIAIEAVELQGIANLLMFLYSQVRELMDQETALLSFMVSLLLTRGIETVKSDMDDGDAGLIGQFGHTSQELVNLIIAGEAVTNVFDWERVFESGSDRFVLRGIERPQVVGYLTELEALRYCEVGLHLKYSVLPVWVVGSASHFTTAFALDPRVADAQRRAEAGLRKAWHNLDKEDCGFISCTQLGELQDSFGLSVRETISALDPTGDAGIIVKREWLEWAVSKLTETPPELMPPRRFVCYHYDGKSYENSSGNEAVQLKHFVVEMDSSTVGSETAASQALTVVLRTRWENCVASEVPL